MLFMSEINKADVPDREFSFEFISAAAKLAEMVHRVSTKASQYNHKIQEEMWEEVEIAMVELLHELRGADISVIKDYQKRQDLAQEQMQAVVTGALNVVSMSGNTPEGEK